MKPRRPVRHRTGAYARTRPRVGRYPYPIHRRARPRKRGGSRIIPILLTLSLALVLFVAGTVGAMGFATVAAVSALSEDLPDPAALGELTFSQPTVVYDKSGDIELGRFQQELRWVVDYEEVPKLVLDATTTAEDRSFWENEGYDPTAILQAIEWVEWRKGLDAIWLIENHEDSSPERCAFQA